MYKQNNTTINIIGLTILLLLASGCTIKQNDGVLTKTVKHTVNTPVYLGKAVESTLIIGLAVVASPLILLKEDEKETITQEASTNDND